MDALERYIHDFSSPEEELLHELDRQTHLQVVQPRMLSGHIQGKLLELLVRMLRPRNILEIGTFTGYSALCMAAGLEEGSVLDTVEVDDELEEIAASFFCRSPHGHKIRHHVVRRSTSLRHSDARSIWCSYRVPSLRKEPYVWHLDDFRAGLEFEINGLEIPGSLYKSFTRTWADVYESLDRSEFGRYADIRNPFKDEVAAIVARNADDERRQLHEILKFVQSRIAWDGTYRLTPESSPHAAVDKRRGDSGSINFILAAALRDAGFKPEIILLNPRSAGRLPLTHATDRIRTFVLRTKLKSGETVYLDATDLHSDVNVLPTQLLVDHARLYSPEHPFENWINLSSPAQSVVLSQITARLTEEGELECTETDTETNQAAYDLSRRYSRSENHDTFVQEYEQRAGITISELTVDGLNTAKARMKLNFRKPVDSGGDFLYICPTIVPFIEKNPFTSQKRQLPVEFSYPYRYRIIVSLMLPEGYTVEELPKSQRLSACNEGIACTMQVQQQGALMQCLFEFDLSRIIFPATEYTDLSAFYGFVMDMCNSRIVLKKS